MPGDGRIRCNWLVNWPSHAVEAMRSWKGSTLAQMSLLDYHAQFYMAEANRCNDIPDRD